MIVTPQALESSRSWQATRTATIFSSKISHTQRDIYIYTYRRGKAFAWQRLRETSVGPHPSSINPCTSMAGITSPLDDYFLSAAFWEGEIFAAEEHGYEITNLAGSPADVLKHKQTGIFVLWPKKMLFFVCCEHGRLVDRYIGVYIYILICLGFMWMSIDRCISCVHADLYIY